MGWKSSVEEIGKPIDTSRNTYAANERSKYAARFPVEGPDIDIAIKEVKGKLDRILKTGAQYLNETIAETSPHDIKFTVGLDALPDWSAIWLENIDASGQCETTYGALLSKSVTEKRRVPLNTTKHGKKVKKLGLVEAWLVQT